ncbi:MAG TPA: HU family DNA-binding protein [Gammaproteobacteria bacterium]|jgi:DNA-binding protein HU-beta|nr:HU family DNA-binding protein [Gammaproteobacteria bacterium]
MNKSQLISTIAEGAGLPVNKAEKTLAATLNCIVETLTQGGSVSLVGFGNFGVKTRAARKVRNPKTGEEMVIEESVVPFFKAGKGLKEQVDTIKE